MEICVDIPDCDYLQILECTPVCSEEDPDCVVVTFTFQNLTDDVLEHAFLFPTDGVTVSPMDQTEISTE